MASKLNKNLKNILQVINDVDKDPKYTLKKDIDLKNQEFEKK